MDETSRSVRFFMAALSGGAAAMLLALALAAPGCANPILGRPIVEDRVQDIIPGRTTPGEVVRIFGQPQRVARTEGREIYSYFYFTPGRDRQELVLTIENGLVSSVHAGEARP